MMVTPKLLLLLPLAAVAASALPAPTWAAGPTPTPTPTPTPPPIIYVPDTAQDMLQTQLAIQRAQAEARRAAAQAQVQAELNANQTRLQSHLAAEQARTQARLAAARERTRASTEAAATAAQFAALSALTARPTPEPFFNTNGEMQLAALTPQLGRYFGTDHGILVVRAPTHGILKLQDGDVILSIGDRTPASSSQAIRILSSYDPGDTIKLLILREHRKLDLAATLPAAPPPDARDAPAPRSLMRHEHSLKVP